MMGVFHLKWYLMKIVILFSWESFEKYQVYLNWRQTEDTVIGKMVPYLEGGEKGLKISQPNTGYQLIKNLIFK